MKKSVLYNGIVSVICAIALICFGKFGPDVPFKGFIFGFAGALLVPGIMMMYKYIHWTKPQNVPTYETKMKEEQIDLNDERKIMLRDKSGHITYVIMIWVLLAVNLIFSAMRIDKLVLLTLWGVWFFQCICGIIVYKHLGKKL